jgi:hypothetical protein
MKRRVAAALFAAVLFPMVFGLLPSSDLIITNGGDGVQATAASAVAATLASRPANANNGYASVKDLMESIIDPSADALWNAVGSVVDEGGARDLVPKTPEEWLDLRHAAIRIIEGSNLLMMQGRDAAPPGTKSDTPGVELEPAEIAGLIKKKRKSFDGFATALRGLGFEALRSIEAKNADSLIEVGGRMEEVCESCHKTFWYPEAAAHAPAGK